MLDQEITLAVEARLLMSRQLGARQIDVATTHGTVTLSGTVANLPEKERALAIAEATRNVLGVINNITVNPVPRSDGKILADVQGILAEAPAAEPLKVQARVDQGLVTLSGNVEYHAQKLMLEQLAARIHGVREIRNQITSDFDLFRSDQDIEQEVNRVLDRNDWTRGDDIETQVNNGFVQLSGRVSNAAERRYATELAWIAGVKGVDNSGLRVEPWQPSPVRQVGSETSSTPPPAYLSDEDIQRAILGTFQNDPRLLPPNPLVDVRGGIVTLYGRVTNLRASQAAEDDARSIAGVRGIRNLIRVRPGVILGDSIVLENVSRALKDDLVLSGDIINTGVQNGVVTLSGAVGSDYARWRAGQDAAFQRGVVSVNNQLNAGNTWEPRSDGEIEDNIEQSMRWDALFKDGDVHVQVIDGNAHLTGWVDSRRAYDRATENAFEGGARTVDNDLRIRNTPDPQGRTHYDRPQYH